MLDYTHHLQGEIPCVARSESECASSQAAPTTPLREIAATYSLLSSAFLKVATFSPTSFAYFSSDPRSSAPWLVNNRSCICQNLPWACAAIPASAAAWALSCIGSGNWRKTKWTLLPYFSLILCVVSAAFAQ